MLTQVDQFKDLNILGDQTMKLELKMLELMEMLYWSTGVQIWEIPLLTMVCVVTGKLRAQIQY